MNPTRDFHPDSNLYACPQCGRLFHSARIANLHLASHDSDAPEAPVTAPTHGWLPFLERMRAKAEAVQAQHREAGE